MTYLLDFFSLLGTSFLFEFLMLRRNGSLIYAETLISILVTKRGSVILNPSTGAVQVRLSFIKLELSDQMLRSYYDSRLRLSDARPPLVRIKDAKIDFESDGEQSYGGANS